MKKAYSRFIAVIALVLALFPASSWAQLTLGQYEDEAPFRTWNTIGIPTAPSLGMGEVRFALAHDPSAGLTNPALLTSLPTYSIAINGSYSTASFYKYSIVNTGVLFTQGNSSIGVYTLDFAGLSATFNDWALGISVGLLEQYDRPHLKPGYEYQSQIVYTLDFQQDGILRNYNISLARKFFGRLALGVGINFVSGWMEKSIQEEYSYDGVTITDYKKNEFKGFYINGGIALNITDKLTAAAIFRSPYSKEAESKSSLRFYIPGGNTDIKIEAAATNTFYQPLILGVGFDYRLSEVFRVASDVSFFNWSSYSVDYYDEELKRTFKNIVKVGGGLEYLSSLNIFGQDVLMPLRVGMIYDPQPMKEPSSHYLYYTIGIGFYWRGLRLDTGTCFGNEKGSGQDLFGRRFSASLSFKL
jgi:hypothetical protein